MNRFYSACALAVLLLCSCVSTSFPAGLTPEAAREEALRDLKAGRPKLYLAGTRGVEEVGVPESDRARLAHLPRSNRLPAGCTDPRAKEAIAYARRYNEVIVQHFR
jgi:hypothetical protein